MNAKGRKELVDSLTIIMRAWIESTVPNGKAATDIGYISTETARFMAISAVNVLEANSDAQRYCVREGILHY